MIYLLGILLGINLFAFALFGADKLFAVLHWRRIRERTLIGVALAGGCLGGLLGMYLFRHKTKKTSFQLPLALGILVEVAVLTLIFWQYK
ncbi:DUF1294 domain-containing protein [Patescibacteria group bacterium]|nr:DUF1294 domain-containing protein [Patescibacteria group bacterium]